MTDSKKLASAGNSFILIMANYSLITFNRLSLIGDACKENFLTILLKSFIPGVVKHSSLKLNGLIVSILLFF
ncbi:hypothetical protein ASU31_10225 [Pedobacter ginsenosidimutans]|uniref:Uncharacterized protein n=1 Tax=Pedobacter ginsenosidimutans TaxID=687842 RepID=A0A0T5VRQ6_9SPHI|nr:hypothetical protein ASU31_10225 [Pedobacter ginsenosidimutans]